MFPYPLLPAYHYIRAPFGGVSILGQRCAVLQWTFGRSEYFLKYTILFNVLNVLGGHIAVWLSVPLFLTVSSGKQGDN